jgi:hypothetical protein
MLIVTESTVTVWDSDNTTTAKQELTDAQLRWELLWLRARNAAYDADEEAFPKFESSQSLDCGFAWVTLHDGRSGFALAAELTSGSDQVASAAMLASARPAASAAASLTAPASRAAKPRPAHPAKHAAQAAPHEETEWLQM